MLKRDTGLPGLPREKVLAVVVSLLDATRVRVGNSEYARDNKSFGLTTLRNRHVTFIRDGRAVETGSLTDLRHLTRTSIQAELTGQSAGLAGLAGVHDLRAHNSHVSFDVDNAALGAALRQLTDAGVRSLVSQPPTLEELFLRHYNTTEAAGVKAEVSR